MASRWRTYPHDSDSLRCETLKVGVFAAKIVESPPWSNWIGYSWEVALDLPGQQYKDRTVLNLGRAPDADTAKVMAVRYMRDQLRIMQEVIDET